ncbi:MAG: primosomal protein N' [Thermoleophilia bacterium]|nr:primosomal protein N' [Thermoleophilia bacterium]
MKPSAGPYARVYIQLKTRSLEHPFDYSVSPALSGKIRSGAAVLVPFGRSKALGLVAQMDDETEVSDEKLQDINAVLDYPPLPEHLITLALWISDYYYCSPAVALGLILPPGGLPALGRETGAGKSEYVLKPPRVRPRMKRFVRATPGSPSPEFRMTAARRRLLDVLAQRPDLPVTEALKLARVSRSTLNSLAQLGVVEVFSLKVRRPGLRYYGVQDERDGNERPADGSAADEARGGPHTLNRPQERALAAIVSRLEAGEPRQRSRPILLMGVAGSGKTEVYLRAIEESIARSGKAIVLVPEISLTDQAVRRFRRRFGDRVGVLHSGLGLGERYDEYMRIRRGAVDVVIGPRSALFAPVPDLRLIVLDEENDGSFKQESEPRYDARRVALERARLEGAAVVYGSATPSLESYHLIKERHLLPERATGAAMPAVEIIDMRGEDDHIFSERLLAAIDDNRSAGGKAILLLNSRGYARFIQCVNCGRVWKCGNCEVSLTMHGRIGRLLCHHCGHAEGMPDICPECGSAELRRWGVGTERLEHEVRRLFPEVPVLRLDADTVKGYGEGPRILARFAAQEKAILVGTQMVAKGHHFPEVTLAAVINADLALQFPEFRAEERTFSLLTQLAGRSGRAGPPGKVIIQTWNAENDCIRMAADQTSEEFYRVELDRRRRLGYPPFAGLINVVCLSREEGKPPEAAGYLKMKLEPAMEGRKLLGPAALFRLQGWFRSHMLVKTTDIEGTLAAMKPVIEHYRKPFRTRGVRIVVDVDPQWLS